MASDTTSREDSRKHLASLLSAALVGAGLPVQEVLDHKTADFFEKSPVVIVHSGPVLYRKPKGMGTVGYKIRFGLDVLVFVADSSEEESWTRANVEDAFDAIEKRIADVIADNREAPGHWSYIAHQEGEGAILPVNSATTGGKPFLVERIPFIVEVQDD